MGENDFDTVTTIAAERNDIGMNYVVNQHLKKSLYKDASIFLDRKQEKVHDFLYSFNTSRPMET